MTEQLPVMYNVSQYQAAIALRNALDVQLSHLKEDLEGRKTFITPTGADAKSLGSNDTERKINLAKLTETDEVSMQIRASIRTIEDQLVPVNTTLEQIEAARRLDEWTVTEHLANAIEQLAGAWRRDALGTRPNPGKPAAPIIAVEVAKEIAQAFEAAGPMAEPPSIIHENENMPDLIMDALYENIDVDAWIAGSQKPLSYDNVTITMDPPRMPMETAASIAERVQKGEIPF
jgi:hypothetical protein